MTPSAPEPPDRATAIAAVLVLLALVLFTAIGPRDDKAWKMWTDPVRTWVGAEKPKSK